VTRMRWPMVPLGEVAPLVRRPLEVEPEGKYREIGIRSHGKGVFHKPPVSGLELGDKRVFRICPGDLLFNIVFAWEGAVALASTAEEGMIGSHRFLTCVVDSDRADASFLRRFFTTPAGLAHLLASSPGGAGRNRTLGLAGLSRISVPLPPLDEQRRIVLRLDAVSARLKARAEAAEQQEAELAATLRSLAATDTNATPMRELLTLRPVDIQVRRDGQYQFSGVYSFGRGVFRAQRKSGAEFAYPRLTTLRAGDFTYPKLMAWEGAYGIVPAECDGTVVSPEFPVFAVNSDRVLPEILAVHFSDPRTWERLSGSSTGTNARRRRLHPDSMLAYEMPVPSPRVQRLLREVMKKASHLRALNAAAAEDAAALMPAMLHQTFAGGTES